MHSDEIIASLFLCLDDIVNRMRSLGETITDTTLVEKFLRSLTSKFESKVSAIEERQDLQTLTIVQLHGILTAYEMRQGGPSQIKEVVFKVCAKGKEKEVVKKSSYISEEEEANFVRRLQPGTGRFKGKLPFKCFECGKVGHYAAKCPYREKHGKGKQFEKRKSYYAKEDDDEVSSEDEEDSDQDLKVLMDKKQKKKATQRKEISQRTCAAENEEDGTGNDCCSCDSLPCACNSEDSGSNVMDLEEVLKIKVEDRLRLFNERESIYKDMISRMNEQKEILNGQIDKYQKLYVDATNRSERLEPEIISIKEDLEKSNKKNEEPLSFEKEGLEAEIISLKKVFFLPCSFGFNSSICF